MQQTLPQIHLLAPQANQFRNPKPVPVGKQDHGGIPITVSPRRRAAAISRSISAGVKCSRLRRSALGTFGDGFIASNFP